MQLKIHQNSFNVKILLFIMFSNSVVVNMNQYVFLLCFAVLILCLAWLYCHWKIKETEEFMEHMDSLYGNKVLLEHLGMF